MPIIHQMGVQAFVELVHVKIFVRYHLLEATCAPPMLKFSRLDYLFKILIHEIIFEKLLHCILLNLKVFNLYQMLPNLI